MKWLLSVLVLLLAALVLESGLLAYAMYVLLGILITSRFLARSWLKNLTAERTCDQSALEIGRSVSVELTIRNHGWLPVVWVLLEDLVPKRALAPAYPRLRVRGQCMQLRMVRSRGEVQINYRLKALMRGYYQIGPLVMETGDLFGLHRRNRVVTEPHYVLVYPKVVPLQGYDLASRRPIGEVRLTHRLYEDPTRTNGVRQYQSGDPLNRVHWRATARTGQIHSKVYEPSTLSGATIMLDLHEAGYAARGEPHRSELAITTAASLTNAVYQLGQQVGLLTNGRDAADRMRLERMERDYRTRLAARAEAGMREKSERLQPMLVETRRGAEQMQRIRETLGRVEQTDGLTFAQMIVEAAGRVPRDATAIAILPAVPVETALALGNLRRRGLAVSAILILIDEDNLEQAHGRLVAEGILDVRHLANQEELPMLCQQQFVRRGEYHMAVDLA
jgi:uncharacterized protein (DUF58 family)